MLPIDRRPATGVELDLIRHGTGAREQETFTVRRRGVDVVLSA